MFGILRNEAYQRVQGLWGCTFSRENYEQHKKDHQQGFNLVCGRQGFNLVFVGSRPPGRVQIYCLRSSGFRDR